MAIKSDSVNLATSGREQIVFEQPGTRQSLIFEEPQGVFRDIVDERTERRTRGITNPQLAYCIRQLVIRDMIEQVSSRS